MRTQFLRSIHTHIYIHIIKNKKKVKDKESAVLNISTTIGTRIAKVPQDVPVENARNIAIANIIAGIKILAVALAPTVPLTNSPMPRLSPMPFNVHAKVTGGRGRQISVQGQPGL